MEAYALATAGGIQGAYRYYLQPELTAKRAWGAIGLFVLAYELKAPPGQLLSEGADASLVRHPILTRAAIGLTALHLMNALPERYDPFYQGLKLLKG